MKTIVIMLFIILSPIHGYTEEVYYPKVNVKISFYAPSAGGINGNPHNKTSFGARPKSRRTIAISRSMYKKGVKPGTKVFIPNLGHFIVEDLMGPKAKGNQIDVCVDSAKEAFKLGVMKNKTIYLVMEEN
jgi:3D (Asp-Asp-Asp) domain-containing protein